MVTMKEAILLLVILFVLVIAMYVCVVWVGHGNQDIRDTMLSIAGGLFGGIGFYYYQKIVLDKI